GMYEELLKSPGALDFVDPCEVAFIYHIEASATPLTRDEFVAMHTTEAKRLRTAILADATASTPLKVLAADEPTWVDLYLAALEDAGLLRAADQAPEVRTNPYVASLMATLAAGILAGPAGDQIVTDGNLVDFFSAVHRWYGDQPGKLTTLAPAGAFKRVPDGLEELFDLNQSSRTHFQAFPVYVRFQNRLGACYPDLPSEVAVIPPATAQYLSGVGSSGQAAIQGPLGYGPENFVPTDTALPYTVSFERPTTSAAAVSELRIVSELDADLDPRSFRLGDVRLGDINVHIPNELGAFQGDFDFTQGKGFVLRVSAGFDLQSNTASWLFQAIDPNTGELLPEGTKGLLTGNVGDNSTKGAVGFTAKAATNAGTGAIISAQARVLADSSSPQDTAVVTHLLDAIAPSTTLAAAPLSEGDTNYVVRWTSTDDGLGSGVKHATVYVSEDGGDWTIWLRQTTTTSDVYHGTAGHTYRFLALATDNAGNREQPPSGVSPTDDGSAPNLGNLPTVGDTTTDISDGPLPSGPALPTNPLFTAAAVGTPAAPPTTRPSEFTTVLQPFVAQSFATGIETSHADIAPLAILPMSDGTVIVSGGASRNELYRLTREGGAVGAPFATLDHPIYDLALDADGNLWASTGGGPLLELDASTGAVVASFGDGLTQTLAIEPATGRVFVASHDGVEIFNPQTAKFSHFSDLRVGALGFAPDGRLWAAAWPHDADSLITFDGQGRATRVARFDTDIDSFSFGQPGTVLENLLFVSHDEPRSAASGTDLTVVDLSTMQSVALARGGSRGDVVRTTADGRVFLSQSHQVDVLSPVVAPRVASTNPPPEAVVGVPLAALSITFDQDMLLDRPSNPHSVLNPNNYRLSGANSGFVPVRSVSYDAATRTALLRFSPLVGDRYELRALPLLRSAFQVDLAAEYVTHFTAIADLASLLDIRFTLARSERATGTVSFDVLVTNHSTRSVLLPLVLTLRPDQHFIGEPLGSQGRAADGSWLIDLSADLPPSGILEGGRSTKGRTISVLTEARSRADFDAVISGVPDANDAPRFVTPAPIAIAAGEAFTYASQAVDPDNDPLTYLLVRGPAGMVMDVATGVLRWTPTSTSPEQPLVEIQVYDSVGAYDSQAFVLTVDGVNRPPVLSDLSETTYGREGAEILLELTVTDPERDPLAVWAENLPPGAVFDPRGRRVVWTPSYSSAGTYENVRFFATDGSHTVSRQTTIVVLPQGQPPEFHRPASVVASEGNLVRVQLQAVDFGGRELTYSSEMLPPGATLDPRTGVFEWTPDFNQHGAYAVPLKVDNGEAEASQLLTISVLNINAPPRFTTVDGYTLKQGQEFQLRMLAFDPDNPGFAARERDAGGALVVQEGSRPSVTYQVSGLPAGASFDPETLLFVWRPGYTQSGPFDVTFTATDDGDGTGVPGVANVVLRLTVDPVNRTPKVASIANGSAARGAVIDVPVSAIDPDGDALTLSALDLPAFATFVDNGDGSGNIRFAPSTGDRGNWTVGVKATDDGHGLGAARAQIDIQRFVFTVDVANETPEFAPLGDIVAVFGSPVQFTVRATDLDQDPLVITASGLPAGATLTPGAVYGTATVDWTPSSLDAGIYELTFRATDDGHAGAASPASVEKTVRLVVRESNLAPTLDPPSVTTVAESDTLSMQLTASDPDGDPLMYGASNLPLGATFDSLLGRLTWKPSIVQAGDYPGIVFTTSDGNLTATRVVTIQVTNTNQPPVILPVLKQTGREASLLQFSLAAQDVDNDAVVFSAVSPLPTGAHFNSQTGEFTWAPGYEQAGDYTLTFRAQDTGDLFSTIDVSLAIANVNRAPTLAASNRSTLLGAPIEFTLGGADPDLGATLVYSSNSLPAGARLDSQTGAFSWLPLPGQQGDYLVTFRVSDGQASVDRTVLLKVARTVEPPSVLVELTPSFPAVPGQSVLIHLAASSFSDLTSLTATLDGQPLVLDAQRRAMFTPSAPGLYEIVARASNADGLERETRQILKVRDPADHDAPVVSIENLGGDAILTSPLELRAMVDDANLDSWVLQLAPLDSTAYETIASGRVGVNGAVTTIDPRRLRNGAYHLRLVASDIGRRTTSVERAFSVAGAEKSGGYLRSEGDLTVQLGGFSLVIARDYDSLDATKAEFTGPDSGAGVTNGGASGANVASGRLQTTFGGGWRLANRDVAIEATVPPTGRESLG
ncbi:MAG TPA: putative Ig domain-containing protein, partial [Pirellulaceae bacterium]|nr:putative Ig domain-containing protein [Pirellulaceae bacterium]